MNSLKDELANAKPFLHAYEVSPFFTNGLVQSYDSEDKLSPEHGFSNCSSSKKAFTISYGSLYSHIKSSF